MMVNGKEIAKSDERGMNVVIVNVAPKVHRTFYAKTYDPNATEHAGPTCWSADGDRPDKSVAEPQSDACMKCEKNINGSGQGNTKACKYGRLVAVALENDLEGDVFRLSLPSQSIFGNADNGKMPLNAYAQFLAGFNVNVTAVVTEMRFDTDSATPKLFFKAVRPLTEAEYQTLSARAEEPEVKELVKVSFQAPTKDTPAAEAPKPKPKAIAAPEDAPEPEAEGEPEQPKKRESKKDESPKKSLASVLDEWDD